MEQAVDVIKIGGSVVDDPIMLDAVLKKCVDLRKPFVLVHGGGNIATRIAEALGIEQTMVDGRRITSKETLDIAVMTYAGLINKSIVGKLQALGGNCVGITGADFNTITSAVRPPEPVNYGYVGDVKSVDISMLDLLLANNCSVVLCAITHDGKGQLLNTNADTIAGVIASAFGSRATLRFVFDYPGVMNSLDDADSMLSELHEDDVHTLQQQGVIIKGMMPKVTSALVASRAGAMVYIQHADALGTTIGTTVIAND